MYTQDTLDQFNKDAWGKAIRNNQMLYPSEKVVAFLARNFKDLASNANKKAIDIGFGSGRHLKVLLDYNFETYGIDYSEDSVKTAKSLLMKDERLIQLKQQDLAKTDFENEFFDVIVCYGVLFFKPFDEMKADLKRVFKLLSPGGKLLLNLATKEDSLYGKGEKIGDNTFLLGKEANEYENMVYTFFGEKEAVEFVEAIGFRVSSLEREDYWKNNLENHRSWWIMSLEKAAIHEN